MGNRKASDASAPGDKKTAAAESNSFWLKPVIWENLFASVYKFLLVCNLFDALWRRVYSFLNYLHNNNIAPMHFMNYGYIALTDSEKAKLAEMEPVINKHTPEDEQINCRLYEKTLSLCPLYKSKEFKGKSLFEVCVGHGGGLNWFAESHPEFKSITGLDICPWDENDKRVIKGDALNMPIEGNQYDVVITVEASHAMSDRRKFFSECYRIIKPGGYLVWTDMRLRHDVDDTYTSTKEIGFELVEKEDITENAIEALYIHGKKVDRFYSSKWYLRCTKWLWNSFHGVPEYGVNHSLKSGHMFYLVACWRKPLNAH